MSTFPCLIQTRRPPLLRHEKATHCAKKVPRTIIQPAQDRPSYPCVQGQTRVAVAELHFGLSKPERMWYRVMEDRLGGSSGSGLLSLGLLSLLGRLGGLALLLLGSVGGTGTLSLGAIGRGPESQVVAEELHDEGAVAVRLLGQRVELSNSIVEGLLREVASTVGRVEDLVVEHREVEGKTEADGVGRGELSLSNIGSALWLGKSVRGTKRGPGLGACDGGENQPYLVSVMSGGGSTLALLTGSELSEVTVVITLPVSRKKKSRSAKWHV